MKALLKMLSKPLPWLSELSLFMTADIDLCVAKHTCHRQKYKIGNASFTLFRLEKAANQPSIKKPDNHPVSIKPMISIFANTDRSTQQMTTSKFNNEHAGILQSQKALSGLDNENRLHLGEAETNMPEMTNAEMLHLRIRMIAMENLIITLLAGGSNQQLEMVKEMATYILPRNGSTQHSLTIKAADQMNNMVSRAEHYRLVQSTGEN